MFSFILVGLIGETASWIQALQAAPSLVSHYIPPSHMLYYCTLFSTTLILSSQQLKLFFILLQTNSQNIIYNLVEFLVKYVERPC